MGTDHAASLHQLVGAGRSRLSIIGAMRTRDVSRPTPGEVAAAEQRAIDLIAARVSGRSRWTPPEGSPPRPLS